MALTIYGSPRSRTMRVLWTAAELGLDYRHVPYEFDDPALKQPDYLRINPAGAIPAIDDDGVIVTESLAIDLYLAKKYGRGGDEPLYPATLAGEAQAWRWTLWAQGHLEPWVQRDAQLAEVRAVIGTRSQPIVDSALAVLSSVLAMQSWLIADHFTVADLNVAAVLSPSRAGQLDLDQHVELRNWLARCYARPAAIAVRQRFAAS
jgi:glutathione S-transferase